MFRQSYLPSLWMRQLNCTIATTGERLNAVVSPTLLYLLTSLRERTTLNGNMHRIYSSSPHNIPKAGYGVYKHRVRNGLHMATGIRLYS
jgi:hypothetical protein